MTPSVSVRDVTGAMGFRLCPNTMPLSSHLIPLGGVLISHTVCAAPPVSGICRSASSSMLKNAMNRPSGEKTGSLASYSSVPGINVIS